jgi:hypothetical protein
VSRDFSLLVFSWISFPPSPWVYHSGLFRIFSKICGDIHMSRCATSINDTGSKFATGVNYQQHRHQICRRSFLSKYYGRNRTHNSEWISVQIYFVYLHCMHTHSLIDESWTFTIYRIKLFWKKNKFMHRLWSFTSVSTYKWNKEGVDWL